MAGSLLVGVHGRGVEGSAAVDDALSKLRRTVGRYAEARAARHRAFDEGMASADRFLIERVRPPLEQVAHLLSRSGHTANMRPARRESGNRYGPPGAQVQKQGSDGFAVSVIVSTEREQDFAYIVRCRVERDGSLRVERWAGAVDQDNPARWESEVEPFPPATDRPLDEITPEMVVHDFIATFEPYLVSIEQK